MELKTGIGNVSILTENNVRPVPKSKKIDLEAT